MVLSSGRTSMKGEIMNRYNLPETMYDHRFDTQEEYFKEDTEDEDDEIEDNTGGDKMENFTEKQFTAMEVAYALDISVYTLNNWCKWFKDSDFKKPEDMPEFPLPTQSSAHGKRTWSLDDIAKLREFKNWLPQGRGGIMGSFNARFWGERGTRAIKNKKAKK